MESIVDSRSRKRNSRLGWVIGALAISYIVAAVVFLVLY